MLPVCAPSVTGWPMGHCLPARAVDGAGLLVAVSTCVHGRTLRGGTEQEGQQTGPQGPGLSTLPLSKWKFRESEKSKFEPGLPGHCESIFVKAEGEKILHLTVYFANEL